jgi:hypothetical protein
MMKWFLRKGIRKFERDSVLEDCGLRQSADGLARSPAKSRDARSVPLLQQQTGS